MSHTERLRDAIKEISRTMSGVKDSASRDQCRILWNEAHSIMCLVQEMWDQRIKDGYPGRLEV
jgi:hypothetical protein